MFKKKTLRFVRETVIVYKKNNDNAGKLWERIFLIAFREDVIVVLHIRKRSSY